MKKDLRELKEKISEYVKREYNIYDDDPFEGFNRTYFSTNENIKDYLDLVDLNNKKNALTVLASGDHAFNLLNKGILNIDTFDINKLSEYYVFGIKCAMILKYNYKDYLTTLSLLINNNTSFEIINDILYDLLPFMDKKYNKFWKEILDYNYNEQKNNINKINLLEILFRNISNSKNLNNYLYNEEEYNKLKNNLNKANLTFKCTNAINLYKKFHKKYDLILLSNIMDYFYNYLGCGWDLEKYINKLNKISNKHSIIFLHYIFAYHYEGAITSRDLVDKTNINKNFFNKYIVEKLPCQNNEKVGCGIILKK